MGRRRLLLTWDPAAALDGGAVVYSKLRGLTSSFGKDPAGHIFHLIALKQTGFYDNTEEESASDSEPLSTEPSRENSTADFSSLPGANSGGGDDEPKFRSKGKKRKSKKRDGLDIYALLGLQHERWMATDAQIKAAYRRAALEHHPDKQHAAVADDEAAKQVSEDRFKAIQEAYETLCDPAKRREFDSLDSFDDSLPGEAEGATAEGFFTAFGAAFKRNSRWSINQPAPELGDDTVDMDHVEAFYDFWFSFKSWREFPHADEEDVESAESREERRWIERYNSKLREKGKKDEFKRIRNFVELAHKLDPRIIARKEAERAERERQKAEREAEKQRKIEEELRKAEEEEKRKGEEAVVAAEAKKQRQAEKKAMQKERSRLRKLSGVTQSDSGVVAVISLPDEDVEALCAKLDLPSLHALCNELAATHLTDEEKAAAVEERLDSVRTDEEQEARRKQLAAKAAAAAAEEVARKEAEERAARLKEWDEEEVRILRKAIDKFPAGTSRRWEQIQAYVRTRTVEEIVDMVKYGLKTGKYNAPSDAHQIAKKRQANTVIKSEATTRDESFSDVDVNLRGSAAAAAVLTNGDAVKAAAAAGASAPVEEKEAEAAAAAAAAPVVTEDWSAEDELALVKALKDIPKEIADRWDRISTAVGTKTKVACAKKFKEMKDKFKAKKATS